jgi:hypothetical protein
VVLVVDGANTLGARPDGWWRDRRGATERLLRALATLPGRDVAAPDADGERWHVARVDVVLEGRATGAAAPHGLEVHRTAGSGDDELVAVTATLLDAGDVVVAVTADRGLRQRLPSPVRVAGPGWLRDLVDPASPVRRRHADDTPS